jgi:hypothetical protein
MYVYSIYAPAISIADANTLPQQQRSSSSSLRPSRNRLKTICVYVVCYHIMCVLYIHTCVYAPTIAVPQQQQQAAPKQEQVGTFLYVNGSVGYFIVLFECKRVCMHACEISNVTAAAAFSAQAGAG